MGWFLMGAGTLVLQVSFVYTHHICYYRTLQHMAVPRVIHTHTPITSTERGSVQANPGGYELRPSVSNA